MDNVKELLVLKNVQIKYASIAEPKQLTPEETKAGVKPDYLLSVYFPKSNEALKQHLDNARINFLEKLGVEKNMQEIYPPLYNDGLSLEDPFFHDKYYLNSKSKSKPDVVDADCNPLIETTWRDFTKGTYVNAVFQLFNYVIAGRKGISKLIKHIQIIMPSDIPYVESAKINYQQFIDSTEIKYINQPTQTQSRKSASYLE